MQQSLLYFSNLASDVFFWSRSRCLNCMLSFWKLKIILSSIELQNGIDAWKIAPVSCWLFFVLLIFSVSEYHLDILYSANIELCMKKLKLHVCMELIERNILQSKSRHLLTSDWFFFCVCSTVRRFWQQVPTNDALAGRSWTETAIQCTNCRRRTTCTKADRGTQGKPGCTGWNTLLIRMP